MSIFALHSPGGKTTLTFLLQEGKLFYRVEAGSRCAAAVAPIGLKTRQTDWTQGLTLKKETRGAIDETYSLPAFKKAVCKDQCRTIDLLFEKDGQELLVQGRAYDDGAAFRLRLLGEGDVAVTDEVCGFLHAGGSPDYLWHETPDVV